MVFYNLTNYKDNIFVVIILFILFGLANFNFTYLSSFLFTSHTAGQNTVLLFNILISLFIIITYILDSIEYTNFVNSIIKYKNI